MNKLSERLADVLIRWRWPLLLAALVLSIAAIWPASQVQFDRSIENVFPAGDRRLANYERLKETFGGNEVVLVVYRDPQLFATDGSGLARVAAMRKKFEELPGIESVLSIDRVLPIAIDEPMRDRLRELFSGYTHSADGQIAALACMLVPRERSPAGRSETVAAMRQILAEDLPPPAHGGMLTGEPVMVAEGYQFVEADGRRLGWATMMLLSLVIIACFRSVRWVVIPIIIVQATLLWTNAMLGLLQLRLSMVSSMLTAVVTVVGVATVVHVIVRFRELRTAGHDPPAALRASLAILALPIFWACATDAVGFGSLLVTRVGPVQDFGTMMAIGSLLVVPAVAMLLPAIVLWGSWASDPQRAWGEGLLDMQLDRLVHSIERHPWFVAIAATAITVVSMLGLQRLEVESDFTKNFRSDSQIVQSYAFVEEHLGGAGVWDVMLPAPSRLDFAYLERVRRLEARLRSEVYGADEAAAKRPGLTKVLSLADAVEAVRPNVLDPIEVRTPFPLLTVEQTRAAIEQKRNLEIGVTLAEMQRRIPTFYQALFNKDPQPPDGYWLRVMLRSHERQSSRSKRQIIEDVTRIAGEEFPASDDPQQRSPIATGFFVLLTYLIDNLLADQWLAFLVACAGILLMMFVALRNPLYALVALVPNVIPIMIVTGLMGWLGLKINMGAAMIAAVTMGLSIDSSIHYIGSFQTARAAGFSVHQAIAIVHNSVGRALVFATLALIAGFTVLCVSEFVPTIYFGALVSLTMLGGLAGNLVVLPLLLKLTTWERNKSSAE